MKNIPTNSNLKAMPLWQTILVFGVPMVWGFLGMYWLLPLLANAGVPMLWNYLVSMVSMFPLLLFLSLIALRIERGTINWQIIRERFRLYPLSKKAWLWTFGLTIVFVGGQLLLLPTSTWLLSIIPIPLPESLPPAIDPRVPKTSIPTELWGIPLHRNWIIALIYLIILILNIISEEFWWRGYILPRQELRHGKNTWIIHGIFWTLFHAPFWWNLIALLPSTLSLSYVVSKLKNSTPGIIVHAILNGLGFIIILFGVIGIGR